MLSGFATAVGSSRFAARFPKALANGFYRPLDLWTASSLGVGTYLGDLGEQTDVGYYGSILAAFSSGVNLIDTAINYRHQRSEVVCGSAIRKALRDGTISRDELIVCTKAGYLTPGAIPEGGPGASEIIRDQHCMHPAFLEDQVMRSRENLGLETIDVHYLHNPETQLAEISRPEFLRRIQAAFQMQEQLCARGWIQAYGVATWDGFRRRDALTHGLQLAEFVEIAHALAGDPHHFRFVQLPFNLAMTEAACLPNQQVQGAQHTLLEAAQALGIQVVGSAPLLQARLTRSLPEALHNLVPEAHTDAQCALQFARSAPGITTTLVGMSSPQHVSENLQLADYAPFDAQRFQSLLPPKAGA